MYQALKLKYPNEDIPCERTVYRIMEEIGLSHRPNRKPNGITKADRNARKSDDLLKRDFTVGKPLEKCVTDITEIPAQDGKLHVSAIFGNVVKKWTQCYRNWDRVLNQLTVLYGECLTQYL